MEYTKSGGLSRFDPRKSLLMACALGSSLALLVASLLPIWEETHYPYSLLWIPQRVTLWTVAVRLPDERRSIADRRGGGWPDSVGALVERQRSNLFLAMAVLFGGAFLGGVVHCHVRRGYRQATDSRGESGVKPRWPVMIVLFLGAAGGAFWYVVETGWTRQKVERIFAADLRLGTSRAEVEARLDALGISHTVIILPDGTPGPEVMAEIPNANVDFFWGGEIQIYFLFDGADRLVKYRVETYTICP